MAGDGASDRTTARRLLELRGAKYEALQRLRQGSGAQATAAIRRHGRVRDVPLSYEQQRLWFLDRLDPASDAYNLFAPIPVPEPLSIAAVRRAVTEIVRRHQMLRTTFRLAGATPVQDVQPAREMDVPVVRIDAANAEACADRIAEHAATENAWRFDLQRGPLIRAVLYVPEHGSPVLLVTLHHIVADGWSLGILFDEFQALYHAFAQDLPSPLPEPPVQYADFAIWQRESFTEERLRPQLDYWKRQLARAPVLQLPTQAPMSESRRAGHVRFVIAPQVKSRLKAFNHEQGVTMYMTLLAVFQLLLHRYSGQDDIVVGSPVAGRGRPESERLIGFFVNFLVLRSSASGRPTFREYVERVRKTVVVALAHQDVPFERLVQELQLDRHAARNPLFQATFQLFTGADRQHDGTIALDGPVRIDRRSAAFDLVFNLWESGDAVAGRIEFPADLFESAFIGRMAEHFQRLLDALLTEPDRTIDKVPLLTETECDTILVDWNDTATTARDPRCIDARVRWHALHDPDRVAVADERHALTYGDLNRGANRLANRLCELGVTPESPIIVCVPRSAEMVVALLGVIKAGAAYVPVEPSYPAERIAWIARDVNASMAIIDGSMDRLASSTVATIVDLASVAATDGEPPTSAQPDRLAYVLYTSGSTGTPKGVEVEHRSLMNLVGWHCTRYEITPSDRTLQTASLAFDAAGWEIWPYLAAGASVHVASDDVRADPERILECIARQGITVCFLATPLAEGLLRLPPRGDLALRHLLTGGDRLRMRPPPDLPFRLHNHYGPTENTVVSTVALVEPDSDDATDPGIGKPIDNTQLYVLDHACRPVPIGVSGEIFLGGANLARGYRASAATSGERFVPNPFASQPGSRLYRTGDLARLDAQGNVHFLGRCDRQVKVRGFRIEPAEVENALRSHPGVRDVLVATGEDDRGATRLVCYYVAEHERDPSDMRAHASRRLPEYMVPAAFVRLDAMPLTGHGKIDVARLPSPQRASLAAADQPATDLERTLAGIWADVLEVQDVGLDQNFFTDFGGHSLLTIAIASRLRAMIGIDVPLRVVFEAPTVRGLAARIAALRATAGGLTEIPRRLDREQAPCSFAQRRLWFLDRLSPGGHFYNVPAAIRVDAALDVSILERAVNALIERHEILRTTFHDEDGEPMQRIAERLDIMVAQCDLRGERIEAVEDQARLVATREARKPFDLERGPLLRVGSIRLAESQSVLLLTMHHIVCDAWSMQVFLKELWILYEAFASGQASTLPALRIQYADFAAWQHQCLTDDVLSAELTFWKQKLAGVAPLEFPTDRARPALSSYRGGREFVALDTALTALLRTLSERQNATLFMTLLAAFKAVLWRYSGQHDIAVGTLIAGRNRKDIEPLLGMFVNTLVLRDNLSGSPSFVELLARVKQTALDAYAHADLPFERLVEELQPARDLGRNPLVQVTFQLLEPRIASQPASTAPAELEVDRGVATFDLSLDMWRDGDRLCGRMEYSTDLFDPSTIERLLRHFVVLLRSIAAEPERSVDALRLMSDSEFQQITVAWNETARMYPARPVHELCAARAAKEPRRVAVVAGDRAVSYGELEERASDIGRALRDVGVRRGDVVGVHLARSADLVASMLGVWKAGAAFMPLDPEYPVERLSSMLSQARPRAVVASGAIPAALADRAGAVVDLAQLARGTPGAEMVSVTATDPAYLMFTSGSTGVPKGVSIAHASLTNHAWAVIDRYRLSDADRVLQFAPVAFDVSIEEIVPTLAIGGAVVLRPAQLPSARDLVAFMRAHGVTVANLPAPYWHEWADALERGCTAPNSVRLVVVGSDRVDPSRVERWLHRHPTGPTLINAYGTTECTITSLVHDVDAATTQSRAGIPAGRPLANVTAYVLDERLQPVAVGAVGELYIGGAGVALGYLNGDSTRFMMHPLSATRLYRTGDRAYFLPDGEVVVIGRTDRQLKVRGFRVEPAEIEDRLAMLPGVRKAIVAADTSARLIAYLESDSDVDTARAAAFLRERVPAHMVPSSFVTLRELPLATHGKIDVGALAAAAPKHASSAAAAPTRIETTLIEIWRDVLGLSAVGLHDNFFDLGGHSLLLLRLQGRLESAFQRDISVVDLFRYPTIASFVSLLTGASTAKPSAAPGWRAPRTAAPAAEANAGNIAP